MPYRKLAAQYYYVKPFIPRRLQILLRRRVAAAQRESCREVWPIDPRAGDLPEQWQGWPDGKRFAVVLTHDVDTSRGHDRCHDLMELEEDFGFRSSFNFVAAGYEVSARLRGDLAAKGFEVGVHGLTHSRKMYESLEVFSAHADRINEYLKAWGSVGFRSPCMYHNLEWLGLLDVEYDASTFDTDPFEPQPDGVGTIFPFHVPRGAGGSYVELPYTLPQDFTLFILFNEQNIDTWKKKVDWIAEKGGMVLLNTHPDYMCFAGDPRFEEYRAARYAELLSFVRTAYRGEYWHVLPKEMARFWAERASASAPPPVDAVAATESPIISLGAGVN